MGWTEDHRKAVADRWGKKFRESGMDADKFAAFMKRKLLEYGWSEAETDEIIARALKG